MTNLLEGAGVGGIGMISLIAGGAWSAIRQPSDRTRSIVQHLAAGTVFAGLVGDLLARLLKTTHYWPMGIGMAFGLALMMLIRTREQKSQGGAQMAPFIIADVLTDGVLMGLSIASGSPVALVFVIALAPELTTLGLTLTDELGGREWSTLRRVGVPALLGVGVVTGGVLGAWARSGSAALAVGIEGFGSIALVYLVTEALLRAAHEREETPWIAATFFAGFIPFFIAAAVVS